MAFLAEGRQNNASLWNLSKRVWDISDNVVSFQSITVVKKSVLKSHCNNVKRILKLWKLKTGNILYFFDLLSPFMSHSVEKNVTSNTK